MKHFFISYNREDGQWAQWIAWQLEHNGYSTVNQAWDFGAGSAFVQEMHQAAIEAERTIAVLSDNYLTSDYCAAEWQAAFASDPTGRLRKLIPVRVRLCNPDGLLKGRTYINLVGKDEATAKEVLLTSIKSSIPGERGKPGTQPDFPASPVASAERALTLEPRFPGSLPPVWPPVWNIAHKPNPHFVGRDELLDRIHQTLASSKAAALTAIHGLGGVGKTQLATEYAYQHAADYQIVWWIKSERRETMAEDLSALAVALNLPEKHAREIPVIVEAVRLELNRRGDWLLVFDNARSAEELRDYLPAGGTGHVLITSRDANWLGTAQALEVTELLAQDAARFLLERTGQRDEKDAGELASELGYLPLALEQAAA